MSVWKRLTGRKSLISLSFRKNERTTGAVDLNKKHEAGKVDELDKWQPKLVPGEKVVSRTSKIIYSNPYNCTNEDQVGDLYVTNFRVIFHPYSDHDVESNGRKMPQRNKLIGNNDLALYNIDAIYSVKKKKKKILQDKNIPRQMKALEIHCKDFRIHVFQLKLLDEKQDIVHAILTGAFPQQMQSLFAFQFSGDTSGDDVLQFNSEQDWQELLNRKGASGLFRVVQCNTDFKVSHSLPECFAVPNSLKEPELLNNIQKFSNNRCPIWSYTHASSGASLVRMANCIPGLGEEPENKMIEHIRQSHPLRDKESDLTVTFDLTKSLPSLPEVQNGFEILRHLCTPESMKEFWQSDATWYSALDSCHWLAYVRSCLLTANNAVDNILKSKTVILKETDAVDFAPLISCIVQLLLDSETRTLTGFQQLVEKEWVALGHKFAERYGNCRDVKGAIKAAVFPLFLDCVWQLLRQFPAEFQFTEYYLVSIWDSVCLGLFRNFLFDTVHSSRYTPNKLPSQEVYIRQGNTPTILSAWDWEKQFTEDQISLFYSPQYVLLHDSSVKGRIDLVSQNHNDKSTFNVQPTEKTVPRETTLVPKVLVPDIQLWSLCYLRWLPPVEIIGGGPACDYLLQCILVEEILYLCQQITQMEKASKESRRSGNRRSMLIFGSDNNRSFTQSPQSLGVSSSFPYAADWSANARLGAGSFIDSYYKNSIMCEENMNVDELDD